MKIIFGIFLLIAFMSFIIGVENVCCEKTKAGVYCAMAPEKDCVGGIGAPTSCIETAFCKKGTCINTAAGKCEAGVGKAKCESEKGAAWSDKDADEIKECKMGCCFMGDQTAYLSSIDCDKQYEKYGLSNPKDKDKWREDMDEEICIAYSGLSEEGACVFEQTLSINCKRATKEECDTQTGKFYKDMLCTAQGLSDCSKTTKTTCYIDGKVYYLDTCGNKANVYDKTKYNDKDYWEKITESSCTVNLNGNAECGNCDYYSGSMCKEYKSGDLNMPKNPDNLKNVCVNLGCRDKYFEATYGRKPEQGESWCVGTNGSFYPIEIDLNSGVLLEKTTIDSKHNNGKGKNQIIELKTGVDKYNLPGSMYYTRSCWNGEVTTMECDPHRESICKEGIDTDVVGVANGYRVAYCYQNNYQLCLGQLNRDDCEASGNDCKWLFGYKLTQEKVTTTEDRNPSEQGICLPMYAPGFNFWKQGGGAELCGAGDVLDMVLFQSSIFSDRDEYYEKDKDGNDKWDLDKSSKVCLENCHLLPFYAWEFNNEVGVNLYDENPDKPKQGTSYESEIQKFWQGGSLSSNVGNYQLSTQKGYYCHKAGEEDKSEGSVKGNSANCLDNDEKRQELPVFYTHQEYIYYLQQRARSLGDCGYKSNAFATYSGDPNNEILTSNALKVGQKLQIKKDLGNKVVYRGFNYDRGYQEDTYKKKPKK